MAETNSLGQVTRNQVYSPYGETHLSADGDTAGFTGHRNDADTGLVYMQARYYDPISGRFLSTDPVTFSADKPEHFNRYWYAGGNPLYYIDPDGLAPDAWGMVWDEVNTYQSAVSEPVQQAAACTGSFSCRQQVMGGASAGLGASALVAGSNPVTAPAAGPLAAGSIIVSAVATADKVIQAVSGDYEWTNADTVGTLADASGASRAARLMGADEVVESVVKIGEQAYGVGQDSATAANPPETVENNTRDTEE